MSDAWQETQSVATALRLSSPLSQSIALTRFKRLSVIGTLMRRDNQTFFFAQILEEILDITIMPSIIGALTLLIKVCLRYAHRIESWLTGLLVFWVMGGIRILERRRVSTTVIPKIY